MNTNWNVAASASHWANFNANKRAETTGAVANNQKDDPIFKHRNAETAGAVAMFENTEAASHQFMAVA